MKQYESLFEQWDVVCQSLKLILDQQNSLDPGSRDHIQQLIDFVQRVKTLKYSHLPLEVSRSQVSRQRESVVALRRQGVLATSDIPSFLFDSLEDFVFQHILINRGLKNAVYLKEKFFPCLQQSAETDVVPTEQDLAYFKELNALINNYGLKLDEQQASPPKCCLNSEQFKLLQKLLG